MSKPNDYHRKRSTDSIERQIADLLKSIEKDPDNETLLSTLTELSMVKAEHIVGKRDESGYEFAGDEVENTVITADGCDIYIKFEEEGFGTGPTHRTSSDIGDDEGG